MPEVNEARKPFVQFRNPHGGRITVAIGKVNEARFSHFYDGQPTCTLFMDGGKEVLVGGDLEDVTGILNS